MLLVQILLNENDIADVQAEYEGPGMLIELPSGYGQLKNVVHYRSLNERSIPERQTSLAVLNLRLPHDSISTS